MGDGQLGSIEYAIEDLGCKLVLVLGHTQCGAVGAALQQNKGYLKLITDKIKLVRIWTAFSIAYLYQF
mgnify:CR=1 FL=1